MRKSCPDCGTLYSGPYCPWCNEELYIYEEQILPEGMDIKLSDSFVEKVKEQRGKVRKECNSKNGRYQQS